MPGTIVISTALFKKISIQVNVEKTRLQISVRALVEYILRSGDLELTVFSMSNPVEAIRAHQKIQRSRPAEYTGEVTVRHQVETGDFIIDINGRIDGVFEYPDRVVIDEIKTTRRNLTTFEETENSLHWGQVKCYAYIYAYDHALDIIDAQLTYYRLDTGETREQRRSFSKADLGEFFGGLLAAYLERMALLTEWGNVRDASIRELSFPFERYRTGQRSMAAEIYRTIADSGQLIVQAPTGIGKTMAALFPAVKALAEGHTEKLFYLTARTTGRTVAEQALDILRENGLRLKHLSLTAKEKICFNPDRACSGDECEFARGHFDRIDRALTDAFTHDSLTRETIEKIAREHRVCPFECSLDLSLWVDCIICDYNYAFDPRVYLRRFFENEGANYTFLIDEAHNLVDRARDMFSADIRKQPFLDLRQQVKDRLPGMYRMLGTINSWLLRYRRQCEVSRNPWSEKDAPVGLYPLLRSFISAAERRLMRNEKTPFRESLLDVYFNAVTFMKITERFDDSYAVCYEKMDRDLRVKLFCMDPSRHVEEALERGKAAIFFSATMTPTSYFRTIFGCRPSARSLLLSSPFPPENLCVMCADRISTLFRRRDSTKAEIAAILASFIRIRKGNYLVYFPSYDYMMSVYELFDAEHPGIETIVQTRGMTEEQRDLFLEHFSRDNEETLTGFAVMGGIFAESIDLVGERLTGAVIVGVGLPGLCLERDLVRDYYAEHEGGAGFEFAYLYPGFTKVLQAAGRVIRSEHERGVVLLIDERFGTSRYTRLFPREWKPVSVRNEQHLEEALRAFWRKS